jgi:alpha-ketoglutarate-dependent taurine dioxygenase
MYVKITHQQHDDIKSLSQKVLDGIHSHSLVHVTTDGLNEEELHDLYSNLANTVGQCLELGETEGSGAVSGYWTYVCYDPTIPNAYRSTKNPQPLHTDGSYQKESPDMTCMYCIKNASEGGETTFISAEKLVGLLQQERPALFQKLTTTPVCFSRSFENADNAKMREIINIDANGKITLTWNYYRVDASSSQDVKDMCEEFHQFLEANIAGSDHMLALRLNAGEGVFWWDERLLHGRNGFVAQEYGDRNLAKVCLKVDRQQ